MKYKWKLLKFEKLPIKLPKYWVFCRRYRLNTIYTLFITANQNGILIWDLVNTQAYQCFQRNKCIMISSPHLEIVFLKRVSDMIKTHSQIHHTDKYSQHSSVIWPVWLNGWVFVYEPSGCEFASRCRQLNFRNRAFFEQGVPWNSGNYRVRIQSKTCMWHDKNTQSDVPYT